MNTEFITPVNLRNEMLESINKYNKSKIYKIVSASSNKIYIGSTTQSLQARLQNHIKDYKQYLVGKRHYTTSYDIISLGDYSIQLISNHVLENKQQLLTLEGNQIRLYRDVCVNMRIAGRTIQEYYEEHKETISEYKKQYHLENLEKIKQHRTQSYTCECGSTIHYQEKSEHQRTPKHFTNINKLLLDELPNL